MARRMRAHWDLCPSPAAGGEGDPPVGGARRGWVGTERSRGEGVLGTKFTQESFSLERARKTLGIYENKEKR